jgi:hypothetical protein
MDAVFSFSPTRCHNSESHSASLYLCECLKCTKVLAGHIPRLCFSSSLPGPEAYASNAPQLAGVLCNPESPPHALICGRSSFRRQVPTRPHDARDPSSERWNFVGENRSIISPEMSTSTLHAGIFYMPQNCDMGPTALLPLRRKAWWGFFRPGLNPRILGTKGQYA